MYVGSWAKQEHNFCKRSLAGKINYYWNQFQIQQYSFSWTFWQIPLNLDSISMVEMEGVAEIG